MAINTTSTSNPTPSLPPNEHNALKVGGVFVEYERVDGVYKVEAYSRTDLTPLNVVVLDMLTGAADLIYWPATQGEPTVGPYKIAAFSGAAQ